MYVKGVGLTRILGRRKPFLSDKSTLEIMGKKYFFEVDIEKRCFLFHSPVSHFLSDMNFSVTHKHTHIDTHRRTHCQYTQTHTNTNTQTHKHKYTDTHIVNTHRHTHCQNTQTHTQIHTDTQKREHFFSLIFFLIPLHTVPLSLFFSFLSF